MIKLYKANETQFNHNGHILTNCIECTVTEESNGVFNAEFIFPFSPEFETGMIITADTPRGEQYFRIVKPKVTYNRNEKRTKFLARHIFYDLSNNFIENIRPTDKGADAFLRAILEGTSIPHRFTSKTLDVQGIKTANYVRKNPIECMIGSASNSFISLFGGDIERDNFNILIQGGNRDNGYRIEAGKNLVGIEIETNIDDVATRLYPTIVMDQNKVINLPEKYVDSPLIKKYPEPIISEYRINLTETEQLKPIDELYELMRVKAKEKFSVEHTDEPEVNYKVDFVMLEKTEQYKLINILKKLNLNDVTSINVPSLGIDIKAKFIKYRWDGIAKRYLTAELGNFKKMLTDQSNALKEAVKILIKENTDGEITTRLKEALDKIVGNTGGYQKILYNADGLPQGTIWMDTPDTATAKNYILINNNGIAFGNAGLSVPPTVAISIDGNVAGDTAFFRNLVTNLIKSELGKSLDLSSNTSINQLVKDAASGAYSEINQKIDNISISFNDKINNANYVFDGTSAKFYGADFLIYDKQGNLIFGFDGKSLTLTVSDGEVSTKMLPNGFFVESTINGTLLTAVDTNGFRADSAYFQHISSPDITRRLSRKLDIYINDIALGDGSGRDEENASSNFNNAWIRLTGNAEFISYVTINIIFVGKLWVDNINLICKGGGGTINIYSKYKDAIFIGKMKFYNVRSSINLNGENFLYLSAPPVVSEPKEDTETEEFAFCRVHESSVFMDKCKIISNSKYGIYADRGSIVKLTNCDIYGPKIGAYSTNGSSVTFRDCKGTATQYSGVALNGARIAALGNTIAVKSIETSTPAEGTPTVIRKGNLVTITANTPMHMNANDAASGANPVAQFDPGDYYIFNEAYGMINITKTDGVPGGWINPKYKTSGTGTGTITKPLVEVNSNRTSVVVNGDIKGYGTAQDAINGTNQASTWSAGTYAIYTEASGMINITKVGGSPGIWINPNGSISITNPGTTQPPAPVGGEFGHATKMVNFIRSKVGMSGAPAWNWLFGHWVEWCATFVSWAGNQLGYTSRGWKKDGWVPNWAAAATTGGSTWRRFYGYNERPKPGDIFITPTEGHIGFVGWVPETGNIFYSVEGNGQSSQYVTKQERAISGGSVGFFIRPNYQMFEGK